MTTATAEPATPETEDTPAGTASGPDADKGKLFEVPRVAVTIDDTDPDRIKLAFSGSVDLDRTLADDVQVYNNLKDGRTSDITITVHVAGVKTTHRRDAEGAVDAVIATKTLVVTDIHLPE